ncbi:MAG TPA: YheU family protein [Pseudomonadales bacterium]|nr:YheU family protein [Pseudomonadales bacterium]
MTAGQIINIPVAALSDEALLGVIDDYVNREGTDYGHRDFDLEQKRDAVRRQLASGRAVITYDPNTQTTTIVSKSV